MKPLKWPCLVRDFIQDRLYHSSEGYFCKPQHQLGQLNSPLTYQDFSGVNSYLETLGTSYPEYAFLTPVEIFQPWYGYSLANYMLNHRSGPIKIVEIGGGTGTAALSILDFYYKHDRATYDSLEYTVCEISPVLAETCTARLKKAHPQMYRSERLKVVNQSIFDWKKPSFQQVFVIALEVLDNLPHDRVYKDAEGNWSFQAEVTEENGQLIEVKAPITDPVIRTCVELLQSLPEKSVQELEKEHSEGFIYNIVKYWQSWRAYDNIFLPTGLQLLFQHLSKQFPKAHYIIADFDSLIGSKIPASNAPIVQTKQKASHEKKDFSTYLVPRGACDIMFPTDFRYLKSMHSAVYGQDGRVHKSYEFMKTFAKTNWTETKTGYRPMFDDFKNTAIFTSE